MVELTEARAVEVQEIFKEVQETYSTYEIENYSELTNILSGINFEEIFPNLKKGFDMSEPILKWRKKDSDVFELKILWEHTENTSKSCLYVAPTLLQCFEKAEEVGKI